MPPFEPGNTISPDDLPVLLRAAESVVAGSTGPPVTLDTPEIIPRYAHVLRCLAHTATGEALPLILKIPQKQSRRARLMHDAATLDFLNRLTDEQSVSLWPHLYGVDHKHNLVVSEDRGCVTLTDALFASPSPSSRPVAEAALLQHAEALATLASITRNREAEFEAIRATYGPREDHLNFDFGRQLEAAIQRLPELLSAWNIAAPSGWESERHALAHSLTDLDSPFRALTVFDSFTDNTVLSDKTVILIDFDSAAFRPAVLDIAAPRLTPPGREIHAIPTTLADQIESAYRRVLSEACPQAQDDRIFYRAMAEARAFWMLYYLQGYGPVIVRSPEQNLDWMKRQIIRELRGFLQTAGKSYSLPSLTSLAARLEERLTALWNTDGVNELTPFPALRV